MILYHCVTTYQILYCLVHRKKFHENQPAYILLPDFIEDKFPNYMDMKGQFFDEVYTYPNSVLHRDLEKEKFLRHVVDVFNDLFNKYKLDLRQFTDIYVAGAQGYFGAYLVENGISFHFIEEACGMLSRSDVLENIVEGIFSARHNVSKEFGLYTAENHLIKKKICNVYAQVEGYDVDGLEHFDVVVEMGKLDEDFLGKILDFFGITEKIEIEENSVVVLTQHFANLKIMSYENQKEIYQLVIDYFAKDYNVVFKPHPDDWLHYEILFPKSKSIKHRFPSELIPFVFTNAPKALMTVTSTAINSLRNYFDYPVYFTHEFEKYFNFTHRYYSALKIAAGFDGDIYVKNSDLLLLKNLAKHSDLMIDKNIFEITSWNEARKNSIIIIDDFGDEALHLVQDIQKMFQVIDDQAVVIFLNSFSQYIFYNYPDKEIFNHIIPIEVKCTDYNEDITGVECFYVYTKRGDYKEMLKKISFEKKLENSNKKISVKEMTEEQLKIKVLEGMLKATERRLDHYIKLEAELRKKLNEKKDE